MTDTLKNQRNNSIDLFRYVCAVLIVVIHTSPFHGSTIGTVLREYCARIAVPFFLTVSGFFYFSTYGRRENALRKFLQHMVPLYLFWSIPYWLMNLSILHDEPNFTLSNFALRCMTEFLTRGSYYHFWFFPALIYSAILATFLWKICSEKTFLTISIMWLLLGCWMTSYSFLAPSFSEVIRNSCGENGAYCIQRILFTGMPYFMLGGAISRRKDRRHSTARQEYLLLSGLLLLYILEKVILSRFGSADLVLTVMLYPLTGWILIVLLRHPLTHMHHLGSIARATANMVYFIHPFLIIVVEKAFLIVFGSEMPNTALFLTIWVTSSLSGYILSRAWMLLRSSKI